jgi:hypothetical protein
MVTESAISWLRPGMIAEFARYSGPTVHIYDIETGEQQVEPVESLTVEEYGAEEPRWRILLDGELLLEVGPAPPGYRQRDFAPPKGYGLITRISRPRMPWPDPPAWVSLHELVRSN